MERFNRIDVEISTPCKSTPVHRVFLNQSGLRQFLELSIGANKYKFQFRSAYNTKISSGILMEGFKEIRQIVPMHNKVNYVLRKYQNDFRKDKDFTKNRFPNGELAKPEFMLDHQKKVLEDMTKYYNSIEQFISTQDKRKPLQFSQSSIGENTLAPSSNSNDKKNETVYIGGKTDEERRREENERWGNFGLGWSEIQGIQSTINSQINSLRENLDMCLRICRPTEYYFSWNFCRDQCYISEHFLSNTDKEMDFVNDLYDNAPWGKIGFGSFILPAGNIANNTWSWTIIKRLWNQPPVTTCDQNWSTLKCKLD